MALISDAFCSVDLNNLSFRQPRTPAVPEYASWPLPVTTTPPAVPVCQNDLVLRPPMVAAVVPVIIPPTVPPVVPPDITIPSLGVDRLGHNVVRLKTLAAELAILAKQRDEPEFDNDPLTFASNEELMEKIRTQIAARKSKENPWGSQFFSTSRPVAFLVAVQGFEDSVDFLADLEKKGEIKRIVIKERTRHHDASAKLERRYVELDMRDGGIEDFLEALLDLDNASDCILIDHGGCFASLLMRAVLHPDARTLLSAKVQGLVELSSRGVSIYDSTLKTHFQNSFPFPMITVVDSEQKGGEHRAVAHDVVERCRWALKNDNIEFPEKVAVIGCCGRVGREIVAELCASGKRVHGYDIATNAYAQLRKNAADKMWDLVVEEDRSDAIKHCGLMINATGEPMSIEDSDTKLMRENFAIANITSYNGAFRGVCAEQIEESNERFFFDDFIRLNGKPRSTLLRRATRNIAIAGALGNTYYILTQGNSPNLSYGPSLNSKVVPKVNSYAIGLIDRAACNWALLPTDRLLQSKEIFKIVDSHPSACRHSPGYWAKTSPTLTLIGDHFGTMIGAFDTFPTTVVATNFINSTLSHAARATVCLDSTPGWEQDWNVNFSDHQYKKDLTSGTDFIFANAEILGDTTSYTSLGDAAFNSLANITCDGFITSGIAVPKACETSVQRATSTGGFTHVLGSTGATISVNIPEGTQVDFETWPEQESDLASTLPSDDWRSTLPKRSISSTELSPDDLRSTPAYLAFKDSIHWTENPKLARRSAAFFKIRREENWKDKWVAAYTPSPSSVIMTRTYFNAEAYF